MASKNRPFFYTRLTTYEELQLFAKAFAEGHLNLLILLGPPGVGKSQMLRDWTGDRVCWIAGNAAPSGIYVECYRHRDESEIRDWAEVRLLDHAGRQVGTVLASE
jgi:hypothetical protein